MEVWKHYGIRRMQVLPDTRATCPQIPVAYFASPCISLRISANVGQLPRSRGDKDMYVSVLFIVARRTCPRVSV